MFPFRDQTLLAEIIDCYLTALGLAVRIGNRSLQFRALEGLGWAYTAQRAIEEYDNALELYNRILVIDPGNRNTSYLKSLNERYRNERSPKIAEEEVHHPSKRQMVTH